MKKKFMGIALVLASALLVGNVYAKEISVSSSNQDTSSFEDGDVIILDDGTYTGDVTITKDVTIKAKNVGQATISGTITVKGGTVVLDGLVLKNNTNNTIVDVEGMANLTIQNTKIQYNGYNGTFSQNTAEGIKLGKQGNHSTVTIKNSEVVAKYAVWVNGEGNTVNIDNSKIIGWAALDITNGSGTKSLAFGNKISVTGSTIEGHGIYGGTSDEYGTIVIGGQKDLQLTIKNSTVNTTVDNGQNVNAHDLFYYSNSESGYLPSKDTQIEVYKSTLTTDGKNGSVIYDLGTEDNYTGNNALYISSDTKTTGALYGENESYVYVTVHDINGDSFVLIIKVGSKISKEDLAKYESVDGYTFDGWYLDKDFKVKYSEKELSEDIALYPKFTKIEAVEKDDAPKTSDTFPMALVGMIALGLAGSYTYRKLHN